MKKDIQKKVDAAFDFHKGAEKLYVTSDGTTFPATESGKNNAKIHARNIGDNKVELVTRSGKTEEVKTDEPKKDEGGSTGSDETPKGETVEGRIDPTEITDVQLQKRLTADFTIKEKLAIAEEFEIDSKEVKGLKDDELSAKLIELATESQRELLIQKSEEKLED